jgi:hypothetical protein
MNKEKRYDVFLSYSHKDRPWVLEFVSALREAGVIAWFDINDIAPGERWQDKVQEALWESSTLVVFLSNNTLESPWTFFELGAAMADLKKIIPVLIQDLDTRRIPSLLTRFRLIKESSPSQAGKQVAEVIKREQALSLTTGKEEAMKEEKAISREELDKFTQESVDPNALGPIRRPFDNVELTDDELVTRIKERNREGKPTYLLRMEYERRLRHRGQ